MDLGRFHPVFLSLVCLQAVAAHVESPTNVTLHCHNLHNVVEWSYDQFLPGLYFKVHIGAMLSPPRELLIYPPTLQADVPSLPNPSDDYYLTVTAVIGQNVSYAAPDGGIFFSYFKDSQAKQKCFVDFPPVNVTAQQDNVVLFRFIHPWSLYHRKFPSRPNTKPRKKKSHDAQVNKVLPELKYDVEINNQRHKRFICEESVCEGELEVVPEQEKYCLHMTGEMQKISIKARQKYCVLPFTQTHDGNDYTYICIIVVIILALIAIAFVLVMVYRKKTKPSTSLPNPLTFTTRLKQWTLGVTQETVSVPEMEPTSPSPLLSNGEENKGKELTPTVPSTAEPDLRLRLGVSAEDEGVCDVVDVGNDEGPGYIPGHDLDEDETLFCHQVSSDYEKRQLFVELAPDEQAEGYRG